MKSLKGTVLKGTVLKIVTHSALKKKENVVESLSTQIKAKRMLIVSRCNIAF